MATLVKLSACRNYTSDMVDVLDIIDDLQNNLNIPSPLRVVNILQPLTNKLLDENKSSSSALKRDATDNLQEQV